MFFCLISIAKKIYFLAGRVLFMLNEDQYQHWQPSLTNAMSEFPSYYLEEIDSFFPKSKVDKHTFLWYLKNI